MNLSQCIKQTQQQLDVAGVYFGHGTDNSADEAGWLVEDALTKIYPDIELNKFNLQMQVGPALLKQVDELLQQRIEQRLPLAYISGEAWFCGLPFYVSPAVLIPRSPIAELIEEGFQPWVQLSAGSKVLDLCTGSACIACAIAVLMPSLQVDATDISESALEVASRNRSRHALQDRLKLLQGDGFSGLKAEKYQLIVSNPPYVSPMEYSQLPAEYLAEPQLGLVSGSDGLDLVVRILVQAAAHLNADGVLICEVGASQPALEELFPGIPFLWLEFSRGGEGVFVLTREQLVSSQAVFALELKHRSGKR